MPSLLDRLRVMFYLTPALFLLLIWIMALSDLALVRSRGISIMVALAFGLALGMAYFLVLAAFSILKIHNKFR